MKVELKDISKQYVSGAEKTLAVDKVSLEIESGELFFLLGPSGCGKTTLLRIIAGLLEPTEGTVLFAGNDVTGVPVEKRNTAMVFQNYALWPHMTVLQNVEFGPKMRRKSRKERRSIASENLTRVQMDKFTSRKPNQLSGGHQQRIALARALAAQSDLLLLDEPLSNLDARLRAHMRNELRVLVKGTGITGIYVTHDQTEALSMADRIAVMDTGRIAQIGTPTELYDKPANRFVADFLGEANFIDGKVIETGPPAIIETAIAQFTARTDEKIEPGSKVTCCIRPERITLSMGLAPESIGDDKIAIPAKVESIVYLGETTQFNCLLSESVRFKVVSLTSGGIPVQDGQTLSLLISPSDICVLVH